MKLFIAITVERKTL